MAMLKKDKMWFGNPATKMLKSGSIKNNPMNPLFVPQQGDNRMNWNQVKKKYPSINPYGDYDDDGFLNYQDCKPMNASEDGELLNKFSNAVGRGIRKVALKARQQVRPRGRVVVKGPKGKLITQQGQPISVSEWIRQKKQRAQSGKPSKGVIIQQKMLRMAYPQLPSQIVQSGTEYQGRTGKKGRGRPYGSVKYPGGIYNYRKLLRAQKAAAKYQGLLQRTRALQQYPQMVVARQAQLQQQQMQQQMQQQYPEMPEEYSQGEGEVPQEVEEYMQGQPQQMSQQVQYPQYPQLPQQMPQIEQRRSTNTLLDSNVNKPYPALESRPLAPTSQTIQQGYIEDVDLMTGRRYIKQLPKAEKWIQ